MADVEHELHSLHSARLKSVEIAEHLTEEELNFRPDSNQWSIGEILDHLILGMRYYGGEIKELITLAKAGKEPVLRRTFSHFNPSILYIPRPVLASMSRLVSLTSTLLPDRFRVWIMRSRMVPTQNPDVANPRTGRSKKELTQDLQSSWNEFETIFSTNPDLDYQRYLHMHPLMGKSNVLMLLRLICLHESRHQDQIQEVLHTRTRKSQR